MRWRRTRRRWGRIAGLGASRPAFPSSAPSTKSPTGSGLDPIEVRRRNVVRTYPYTTIAGLQFESGSSAETLDQMERILDLAQLRREHA